MKLYVILALALVIFSCSEKTEKNSPDAGRIENRVYTNDFFSMEVTIPEGWVVQNEEQMKAMNEESKEIIRENNPEVDIEEVDNNSIEMLTVFEREVSDTAEFNPAFVLMAEKLPVEVPLMNEKVYLTLAGNELRESGFYTSVDENPQKVEIGDVDFYSIGATIMADAENEAKQEFFARVVDDYILLFIISYRTRSQQSRLNEVLETVRFR